MSTFEYFLAKLFVTIQCVVLAVYKLFYIHHQPINIPTAGAQAFLMENT
jgi:hypothetical protein